MPDAADEGRPLDDPTDAAALAQYATALADGIEEAIPRWIDRSVRRVLADQGIAVDDALAARVGDAGRAARIDGGRRVRALLSTDIDAQAGNPLAVLRSLVPHATTVLEAAGARPVTRDEFSVRNFPDDVYDLAPASFADVDTALHEPGLAWGAAKAHVHLARRRREGKR
ncbi:MAG TPA: hypothetical protein VIZ67_05385 [Acidimicrobiales bacterium]